MILLLLKFCAEITKSRFPTEKSFITLSTDRVDVRDNLIIVGQRTGRKFGHNVFFCSTALTNAVWVLSTLLGFVALSFVVN